VIGAARRLAAILALVLAMGSGALWASGFPAAPAGEGMLAGYGEIRAAIDGRPIRSTLEEDDSGLAFEEVLSASCGAGNHFECGLLDLWRTVAALLSLLERLVTLALIAFLLPWLVWTGWRDRARSRRRQAKRAGSGPAIDPIAGLRVLPGQPTRAQPSRPRRSCGR